MSTPYDFDPELAEVIPLLPSVNLSDLGPVQDAMTRMRTSAADIELEGLTVTDHEATRPGHPNVRVRVYRPSDAPGALPALLNIHGGGFVLGSIETEEATSAVLAREVGAVVASVDYRLAPEHPFPAAFDDCVTALQWLARSATELGADATRIAVRGQSAGGALAAALALHGRDEGGPTICFQLLDTPVLDDRGTTESMRRFVDTPLWDRGLSELSWDHYLGVERGNGVSRYAAPARSGDLSGLPPAYIAAGEYDPLRDEAIAYASRILEAGGKAELHVFPGTFHGSTLITSAEVTRRANAEAVAVLRRALGVASN